MLPSLGIGTVLCAPTSGATRTRS